MPLQTVPIFRICDETEACGVYARFRGFQIVGSAALRLLPLRRTPLRCPLLVHSRICCFSFSEGPSWAGRFTLAAAPDRNGATAE